MYSPEPEDFQWLMPPRRIRHNTENEIREYIPVGYRHADTSELENRIAESIIYGERHPNGL